MPGEDQPTKFALVVTRGNPELCHLLAVSCFALALRKNVTDESTGEVPSAQLRSIEGKMSPSV